MEVIDCKWEIQNLKKRTVEILIGNDDSFSRKSIEDAAQGYEYVVIKVPANKPLFNIGLQEMGFFLIETQINICATYQGFDLSKIQDLSGRTEYKVASNDSDLHSVVSMMTPGMFSTDRIAIDPAFGEVIGYQRYVNWITTEYKAGKSQLIRWIYDGEDVGFMLIKIEAGEIKTLLEGLYKPFQGKGLGYLTIASPLIYAHKEHLDITCARTCISSNNVPVMKLHSRLGSKFTNMSYVFVKHVSI